MMNNIRAGFKTALAFLVVFAVAVTVLFCIFIFTLLYDHRVIKSETKIEPKIVLIIKNNAVDTLYVYEQPK